jgi:hypothetical protein
MSRSLTIRGLVMLTSVLTALVLVTGVAMVHALSGAVNFAVLRTFTTPQTQADFKNIAQLWGQDTSYGNINIDYQFSDRHQVVKASTSYLDSDGGNFSSNAAIASLVNDAVAGSPNTLNKARRTLAQ